MNLVPPNMRRIIAVLGLGVALIVMASIFVPRDTEADEGLHMLIPSDDPDHHAEPLPETGVHSTNPHEGLPLIGSLEHGRYLVFIYATDVGPRYTIYDQRTRQELGTLLSEEQIEQHFPELPIRDMELNEEVQLMMVPPDFNHLPR